MLFWVVSVSFYGIIFIWLLQNSCRQELIQKLSIWQMGAHYGCHTNVYDLFLHAFVPWPAV